MSPTSAAVALAVFVMMPIEARRAARNERIQRARDGIEPSGDVYAWMTVAYPASFVAMLIEGLVRGVPPAAVFVAGAAVFVFAKALKWWAITALGDSWTFRVIVVPGAPLVRSGPYRLLRHPNYVAVIGELVGVGLMSNAVVAGPIAMLAFSGLILKRVAVEERALQKTARQPPNV